MIFDALGLRMFGACFCGSKSTVVGSLSFRVSLRPHQHRVVNMGVRCMHFFVVVVVVVVVTVVRGKCVPFANAFFLTCHSLSQRLISFLLPVMQSEWDSEN